MPPPGPSRQTRFRRSRRPRRARGRDGSPTSTSSTRWTAAPRALRWSPATSESRSACRVSETSSSPRVTGRAFWESLVAPRRSGWTCARCAPRRAAWTRCHFPPSATGRETTGSCSTKSARARVKIGDPARGIRTISREDFDASWTGYAAAGLLDTRVRGHPGGPDALRLVALVHSPAPSCADLRHVCSHSRQRLSSSPCRSSRRSSSTTRSLTKTRRCS